MRVTADTRYLLVPFGTPFDRRDIVYIYQKPCAPCDVITVA